MQPIAARPSTGRQTKAVAKRVLTPVNAIHITASVHINDDEGGLLEDFGEWLEGVRSTLCPTLHEPVSQYKHDCTGEGACLKKVTGTSVRT